MTQEIPVTTFTFVGKSWPVDTFIPYLRALMEREGIPDFAELSRLSGVSQTQFSNWRGGTSQPSQASLDKIAPVLHENATSLYVAAGLLQPSQVGMPETYQPAVLPREIVQLIEFYQSMTTDVGKRQVREWIDFALSGLRAKLAEQEQPEPRPRSTRKRAS